MYECVIIGDSIALGLHRTRPECQVVAKGGINTWQFNKKYAGEFAANNVIISLGSNDHQYVKTQKELEALRQRVLAKSKVIWLLPAGNAKGSNVDIKTVRNIVNEIAKKNGDLVIDPYPKHVSTDGIHPSGSGYKWIAQETKNLSK